MAALASCSRTDSNDATEGSSSTAVLAVHYSPIRADAAAQRAHELLERAPLLLMGTPGALLALDCDTYEVRSVLVLGQEPGSAAWASGLSQRCATCRHCLMNL